MNIPWALFLQAADTAPLVSLGVGGAIALGVIGMWRVDRKESQDRFEKLADNFRCDQKESQERYERLAADFRVIVQDNTKALTALSEKLEANDALTVRMLVEAMRTGKIVNVEATRVSGGGAD